jgi:transketolase
VARTVFGKGVSYMEGQIAWNYLPMTEVQYRQALQEVG